MYELTVAIPADVASRIAAAICLRWGYDDATGDDPYQFTQRIILRWLGEQALDTEAELAAAEARTAARTASDPLVRWLATI